MGWPSNWSTSQVAHNDRSTLLIHFSSGSQWQHYWSHFSNGTKCQVNLNFICCMKWVDKSDLSLDGCMRNRWMNLAYDWVLFDKYVARDILSAHRTLKIKVWFIVPLYKLLPNEDIHISRKDAALLQLDLPCSIQLLLQEWKVIEQWCVPYPPHTISSSPTLSTPSPHCQPLPTLSAPPHTVSLSQKCQPLPSQPLLTLSASPHTVSSSPHCQLLPTLSAPPHIVISSPHCQLLPHWQPPPTLSASPHTASSSPHYQLLPTLSAPPSLSAPCHIVSYIQNLKYRKNVYYMYKKLTSR